MGMDPFTWIAIGTAVVSAVTGFASISAARRQADTQAAAAEQQAKLQYQEINRQQGEVNRIAQEQESDRIRKARQELGTLRVVSGERGVSGNTFNALATELGYVEGLDLSRIESNRANNIQAGEAQKKATQQGALNTVDIAANQAKVATMSGVAGIVGSGLQIAGGVYQHNAQLQQQQQSQELMLRLGQNKVN